MVLRASEKQPYWTVLNGQYTLGETIGSGGFGKVKLATHILTGEKVAIKIIDKKAIGEDLPRVTTELRALKTLSHQNICRLYHHVETDEKFFLVLEYCSGGELFDYIVKKECLPESEARHFFRQIITAIAYVHKSGFAHRDLKPENLLLTDDLQLKLIDFGLCANPQSGLQNVLQTCCGSPAYAAPELIKGENYYGNEADIWSMGILLYALLCGFLPFEDEHMPSLYNKIAAGKYQEPNWLSNSSKIILRAMLQTDPRQRITIEQLLVHPWVARDYTQPLKWRSIYDGNIVDEECAAEMARYNEISKEKMIEKIREWKFDYLTATYFLLLARKRRRQPVYLPLPPRSNAQLKVLDDSSGVLHSPTIHASLDEGMDQIDTEPLETAFLSVSRSSKGTASSSSPKFSNHGSRSSYNRAVEAGAPECTPISSRIRSRRPVPQIPPPPTPLENDTAVLVENDENLPPPPSRGTKSEKRPHVRESNDSNEFQNQRPKSVYATPHGHKSTNSREKSPGRPLQETYQQWAQETPLSQQLRALSQESLEGSGHKSNGFRTPGSPCDDSESRTPRSKTKTPRFSRKMFASVERKMDRVINMLTPRKTRDTPITLRRTKTLVNVSTTSSSNPDLVLNELLRVFESKGITCEQNGWKIHGKAKDRTGRTSLTLELEVVHVEHLNTVGVRRKRLNGDSFMYKRVCEDILKLASL